MPPGQEGKIELAVEHTEGYAGEISKSASVSTNDPKLANFNLFLRARFISDPKTKPAVAGPPPVAPLNPNPVFTVEPGDRWITGAISGSSAVNYFYLYNPQATPFRVKNVINGGSDFITALQTLEDGKRYELRVASNPGLKPGHYTQTLKLATDSPAQPEVSIEIELNVIPKVFASPTSITVPALEAASDLSSINLPAIYIRKIREQGLKIKSYRSTLPFLKLALVTETEGQVYKLQPALDGSKVKPGEHKGKIMIETNDAEVPVIEIPVQASFR